MTNPDHTLRPAHDAHGHAASPQLPEGVKNYLIDIDGTITEDVPNEEPERMATCAPFPDALDTLNRWYDEGHIITFFTSRTEEHRDVTEAWLRQHGFKYHGMLMGKPRGGITTGWTTTSSAPRGTKGNSRIWCGRRRRWKSSSPDPRLVQPRPPRAVASK